MIERKLISEIDFENDPLEQKLREMALKRAAEDFRRTEQLLEWLKTGESFAPGEFTHPIKPDGR